MFVENNTPVLYIVATQGQFGGTYNIGGHNEKQNIEVASTIYQILNELQPQSDEQSRHL